MHDVARPASEDGVELVLACGRKAVRAAVLETRKAIAVVPAPRALADVARQSPDVADLRCADAFCRRRQYSVTAADRRVVSKRIQGDQAADSYHPLFRRNAFEPANRLQVHHEVFLDHSLLEQAE